MHALRTLLLSAAAGAALLVNGNAGADPPVAIAYVPNSLAQAGILGGPWTLHQRFGRNPHDASGIAGLQTRPTSGSVGRSYRSQAPWNGLTAMINELTRGYPLQRADPSQAAGYDKRSYASG